MSSGKLTVSVNYSEILGRIKEITGLKHQKLIAANIGLSEQDFSQRKKRGTLLVELQRWAEKENISIEWLIFGRGKSTDPNPNNVTTITDKINEYVKNSFSSGVTLGALARKAGISETDLQAFLDSPEVTDRKILDKLSALLSHHSTATQAGNMDRPVLVTVLKKISKDFPNTIRGEEIEERVYLPDVPDNSFAIKAIDDGMLPTIKKGDYVVFLPGGASLNAGDLVVIRDEWDTPMVRRYRLKDGSTCFSPDNPEFPIIDGAGKGIIGIVTDIWSRKKP